MPATTRLAALRRHLATAGAAAAPAAAAAVPELPPWYAEAATLDETLSKVQLDPASWARHRLNADSRAAFDRDGYLIINDVLPPDAFQAAVQALDDLKALRHTQGLPPTSSVLDPVYSNSHSLWEEPAVVRMLSTPKLLPKVVDIMGWNVYLYHGHLTVNPPFSDGPATPSDADQKTLGFHQDSGRVNQELEVPDGAPVPRLSVKAAFYLSDLSERGRGQTWVIPGTHKIAAYGPRPQPRGGDGPDANQVIFYGFGYRWMRSKDVMDVGGALRAGGPAECPVIKQLLGWTHTNNGIFSPKAEDVPLRGWMEQNGVLDEDVGLDTMNHGGPLGTYKESGYPWQSHGDRPHSFNAVSRDGLV